ncbi:hypothetical protein H4R34_001557 [Dimargaris verticillata]|uniref:Uncharacterized protein n=1 Tax=Dimargaris verticillata TaxID=2761393 RepID=A0A9W8B3D5_9FUNG|nr:hypothetical protein H4R34_001557 [Dimargaris verticillata]
MSLHNSPTGKPRAASYPPSTPMDERLPSQPQNRPSMSATPTQSSEKPTTLTPSPVCRPLVAPQLSDFAHVSSEQLPVPADALRPIARQPSSPIIAPQGRQMSPGSQPPSGESPSAEPTSKHLHPYATRHADRQHQGESQSQTEERSPRTMGSTLPISPNMLGQDILFRKRGSNNNVWSEEDAGKLLDYIIEHLGEYHKANKTVWYRDVAIFVFRHKYTEGQVKNKITSLKKGYHMAIDQYQRFKKQHPNLSEREYDAEYSKIKFSVCRFYDKIHTIFADHRRERMHIPDFSDDEGHGGAPQALRALSRGVQEPAGYGRTKDAAAFVQPNRSRERLQADYAEQARRYLTDPRARSLGTAQDTASSDASRLRGAGMNNSPGMAQGSMDRDIQAELALRVDRLHHSTQNLLTEFASVNDDIERLPIPLTDDKAGEYRAGLAQLNDMTQAMFRVYQLRVDLEMNRIKSNEYVRMEELRLREKELEAMTGKRTYDQANVPPYAPDRMEMRMHRRPNINPDLSLTSALPQVLSPPLRSNPAPMVRRRSFGTGRPMMEPASAYNAGSTPLHKRPRTFNPQQASPGSLRGVPLPAPSSRGFSPHHGTPEAVHSGGNPFQPYTVPNRVREPGYGPPSGGAGSFAPRSYPSPRLHYPRGNSGVQSTHSPPP